MATPSSLKPWNTHGLHLAEPALVSSSYWPTTSIYPQCVCRAKKTGLSGSGLCQKHTLLLPQISFAPVLVPRPPSLKFNRTRNQCNKPVCTEGGSRATWVYYWPPCKQRSRGLFSVPEGLMAKCMQSGTWWLHVGKLALTLACPGH